MRISTFFIASIIILFSNVSIAQHCLNNRYGEVALFDSSEITVMTQITYANATNYFNGQNINLTLDVYFPNTSVDPVQHRPVVMMLHGGAFMSGNSSEVANYCMEYARRGFVAVAPTYRLGWNCNNGLCINCYESDLRKAIYCAVQDARAALRFVSSQNENWGIDPNWIFIGGVSAGSITSLLTATWNQAEADSWVPTGLSTEIGGLDESGNSLPSTYSLGGVINHCGAVMNVEHLSDNGDMPIISFHDSNDCVVPYGTANVLTCLCAGYLGVAGSSSIHSYSVSHGHCSELNTVPQLFPSHCSFPVPNLVKLSSCFMKRVMCGFCMSTQSFDPNAQPLCSQVVSTNNGIEGCTYPSASNYNPAATLDDGSCLFLPTCPEDINLDGVVGVNDLLQLIGAYGQTCD